MTLFFRAQYCDVSASVCQQKADKLLGQTPFSTRTHISEFLWVFLRQRFDLTIDMSLGDRK